jgi:hypothetical protein
VTLWFTQPLTEMSTRQCFRGIKRGRRVMLTTSSPSVSQLSRQCGILDILQSYRPPWPVTMIAIHFTSFYLREVYSHMNDKHILTWGPWDIRVLIYLVRSMKNRLCKAMTIVCYRYDYVVWTFVSNLCILKRILRFTNWIWFRPQVTRRGGVTY